jgi:hypothetical protein
MKFSHDKNTGAPVNRAILHGPLNYVIFGKQDFCFQCVKLLNGLN